MSRINLLLIVIILFLFSSCGSTSKVINTLKPDADLSAPLVYDKVQSTLNIPISIKLKDIEYQTNKNLSGLIYEDNQLEDDNIMLKVWKEAPIKITDELGEIKIVLPLKVWAKVRYGSTVFGMNLYDIRELNFNGVVTLSSSLDFSNWQLQSKTNLKSIDWIEKPSITVAGKVVPISFLVNPAMRYFKQDIEKNIDDAIKKSVDLKPYISDALDKISNPILVNQLYDTWFDVVPLSVSIANTKLQNSSILTTIGVECNMETFVGKQPIKTFQKEKLILKPSLTSDDHFSTSLMVVSPYLQASQLITKNFEGQVFTSGNKSVTVQKVDLWQKNGKMIVALGLSGSINGTIYLSGIPAFDKENSEIYFEDLDYVLDTKSTLIKTANWLAQGIILNKIKENARYSIKTNLEDAQQQMTKYLNNYSPASGIFINGTSDGIDINRIQLTDQAIITTINITGKITITIDGLK